MNWRFALIGLLLFLAVVAFSEWMRRRRSAPYGGGRIVPLRDVDRGHPILLSPGAVCCTAPGCDWSRTGSGQELVAEFEAHAATHKENP